MDKKKLKEQFSNNANMAAIEICKGILWDHKGETLHLDSEGDREGAKRMKRLLGVCDPRSKFLEY